jgi:hypothetical protein
MELEHVIVELHVLSQLKKGQKLNCRGQFLDIESTSMMPESVRRWYRHDSRNEMILVLTRIINQAIQLDIQHYLQNARNGLENLKQTYSHCHQTVARLNMLTDKIQVHLKEEIVEII